MSEKSHPPHLTASYSGSPTLPLSCCSPQHISFHYGYLTIQSTLNSRIVLVTSRPLLISVNTFILCVDSVWIFSVLCDHIKITSLRVNKIIAMSITVLLLKSSAGSRDDMLNIWPLTKPAVSKHKDAILDHYFLVGYIGSTFFSVGLIDIGQEIVERIRYYFNLCDCVF